MMGAPVERVVGGPIKDESIPSRTNANADKSECSLAEINGPRRRERVSEWRGAEAAARGRPNCAATISGVDGVS